MRYIIQNCEGQSISTGAGLRAPVDMSTNFYVVESTTELFAPTTVLDPTSRKYVFERIKNTYELPKKLILLPRQCEFGYFEGSIYNFIGVHDPNFPFKFMYVVEPR